MNKERSNKLLYYFLIFLLGGMTGYIYEVIFYYFDLGILNNWGVLYGPVLPIYGIGAVCLVPLYKYRKNPLLVFVLSMLITGIVEYVIGVFSIKLFDLKLWDYTGLFLNIDGIVCFRSVFSFAILALALIYVILPIGYKYIYPSINKYKIFVIVLFIVFISDVVISLFCRTPYTW